MEPRTYFIRTFGCQMNEHDSERIAGLLESEGYERAHSPDAADLIVLNTCAIRENADNKLYGNLGHLKPLKDARPELRIAVGGCQVQKDKHLVIEKAPWVDVAFGTFAVGELPRLLADRESGGVPAFEFTEHTDVFPSALPARREQRFHGWVSVSVGCDNACTFCIVPSVRGPQVSRRLGDVLDECKRLVEDGVVEISLLGQNVNTYGRDLDGRPMFAELLASMDGIDGLRRVRFTSPHPHDFTPDVIEAMAGSKTVCEHIHFPLQSGSDSVLKRMRRSYRSARYLEWLHDIRAAVPGVAVSTDIIVGFPGETDAEFEDTLRVVQSAQFDSAYTFEYSIRPGTEAAVMPDQVPAGVVQERFRRLVALQENISLEKNTALMNARVETLVEGPSRKDPARATARTRTNKIVHVPGDGLQPGSFADVIVKAAHPHYLEGEVA
ncbi:MAG: tRNA (N6-isopentenyl adenosine(37)-C2)-methylthiotransferase MiaB [Actinomycetota bacterium]|nr:tRNA (N6-isopentenyl adenosine(37)-C2)-methylthiotransferase MiaB [Actinomycetota bacterium]